MFAYLIIQRKKRGVGVRCGLDAQRKFFSDFQSHFHQTYRLIQPHPKFQFQPILSLYYSKYLSRIHQNPHNQLFWPIFDNSQPVSGNRLRTLTIICTKFPDGLNRVQKLDGYLHHKIFFLTYKNDLCKILKNSPQRIFKFICVKGGLLFLPLVTNIE